MAFFSKARKAFAIAVAVAVLAPCLLLCGFGAAAETGWDSTPYGFEEEALGDISVAEHVEETPTGVDSPEGPSEPQDVVYVTDTYDTDGSNGDNLDNGIHGNTSARNISETIYHGDSGKSLQLYMNKSNENNYTRVVLRKVDSNDNKEDFAAKTGHRYTVSFWTMSEKDGDVTLRIGTVNDRMKVYGEYDNLNSIEVEKNLPLTAGVWTEVEMEVPFCIGASGNTDMGTAAGYLTLGALKDGCSSAPENLYIDDVFTQDCGSYDVNDIIRAPRTAALFCSAGGGGVYDPQAADNSAVYYSQAKGKYYAAMRVFGEYTDRFGESRNHGSVVINGAGMQIVERGLLVGTDPANVKLNSKSLVGKVGVSGSKLNDYWSYDNEEHVVRYSILLKDIPANKKDTSYTFRSYITFGNDYHQIVVYSDIQAGLILQKVYDSVCGKLGLTDDNKLVFFDNVPDVPSVEYDIPLQDGFDPRFTVVYAGEKVGHDDGEASLEPAELILPSGEITVKGIADDLAAGMDNALGVTHSCTDSTRVTTYEILVGDTGRDESITAARSLDDSENDFVVKRVGTKVAIVANNNDGLELGVQYFVNQYLRNSNKSIPADLSYVSHDHWDANKANITIDGTAMIDFYIRNEKYPSLLVREAVENLQRQARILFGQKLTERTYDGFTHSKEIWVGPNQGAVKAIFNGDHSSDPSANNELVGVNSNGLLESVCGVDGYKIWVEDGKLYINGGSSYAINAGVNDLCKEICSDTVFGSTYVKTGRYGSGYSLMKDYQLVFDEDFNYTGSDDKIANDLQKNWSLSRDPSYGPRKDSGKYYMMEQALTTPHEFKVYIAKDGNKYYLDRTDGKYYLCGEQSGSDFTEPAEREVYEDEEDDLTAYEIEKSLKLADEQQRPAIYGKNGTYYVEDGYLYEITKYVPDAPYLMKGNLDNDRTHGPVWYAGRVTSEGRWNYQYGVLEVRIVMATRNGACSSVWNNAATYAPNGRHLEIDVYENLGQDTYISNVHAWSGSSDIHTGSHKYQDKIRINSTATTQMVPLDEPTTPTTKVNGVPRDNLSFNYYDTFHYISYRWTKTYIAFYMDGTEFGRLNYDQMTESDGDDQVMHTRVNLRLANGIGAYDYGSGYHPHDWLGANYTNFKEKQVVDSVYLFQQKDGIFVDNRA